ncbi:MAG TPA: hypothetical protein V6D12_05665 [Candidatus Obscuribacterales bacterium]
MHIYITVDERGNKNVSPQAIAKARILQAVNEAIFRIENTSLCKNI